MNPSDRHLFPFWLNKFEILSFVILCVSHLSCRLMIQTSCSGCIPRSPSEKAVPQGIMVRWSRGESYLAMEEEKKRPTWHCNWNASRGKRGRVTKRVIGLTDCVPSLLHDMLNRLIIAIVQIRPPWFALISMLVDGVSPRGPLP